MPCMKESCYVKRSYVTCEALQAEARVKKSAVMPRINKSCLDVMYEGVMYEGVMYEGAMSRMKVSCHA